MINSTFLNFLLGIHFFQREGLGLNSPPFYEEEKENHKEKKKDELDDEESEEDSRDLMQKRKKLRKEAKKKANSHEIFNEATLVRSKIPQNTISPSKIHQNKSQNLTLIPERKEELEASNIKGPAENTHKKEENQENAPKAQKATHRIVLSLQIPKNKEEHEFYDNFSIGSDSSNDFEIALPDIAFLHCEVRISPQGIFELSDCGSQFGTFLNLIPEQKYYLEESQVYQIGQTSIKISGIDEDEMGFEVIEGPQMGESFFVRHKKFTIGSNKKNDFMIAKDAWVSGDHCVIQKRKNGGFAIKDNGSTNGTWRKLEESERLQLIPDVNVKLGSTVVIYVQDAI